MGKNLCVIKLPGYNNYALVSPQRIVYGLNASEKNLDYLINEEVKIIKFVKQNKVTKKRKDQFSSISLMPTFDCNLRCIYCYARGGEVSKTMSLETATSAIEAITDHNDIHKKLDLYLVGGGEPLLPFKLVEETVEFAKSLYKKVHIHVVTNGTFNENVLQWLIKNKVDVRISYDGLMHDVQRPFTNGDSSKKIVVENIKSLITKKICPTVQCIVAKNGLNNLRQTVEKIFEIGVKVLKLEPVLATDVSRATRKMEPNPIKYAEALLNTIKYATKLGKNLKIDTGFFAEPSDGYYCGITTGNKIITPDGLVTACVEVAKETDPYVDPIIFGRLKNKRVLIHRKRLKSLQLLHYKKQEGCIRCNLRFICQGGCPMANIWRSGFPLRKSSFTCAVEHKLIPELLLQIAKNFKVASVVFNDNAEIKAC